jgi:RNA-directed DNA polymerase
MPKTFNHLFESICSLENLLRAAHKASRGKRHKPYVDAFRLNLEREVWRLREELQEDRYCPGPYKTFMITDPKPRMISAAPFRDRVVHHALCSVIEPLWERRFVSESYANRKGKGTCAARDHFAGGMRRYRYVLHVDIRKFFPSMDHQVLKSQFRRVIRCKRTLRLMDMLVDSSNPQEDALWYFEGDDLWTPWQRRHGLPLGNQTSQFFANVYMDRLDHFVKEVLCCRHYVRYVDDLALFAQDKGELRYALSAIADQANQMKLKLHPRKSRIYRTDEGVTFLGLRFWPGRRRLAAPNVVRCRHRIRKQVRAYAMGRIGLADVERSWRGWLGHAMQAGARGLIEQLREEAVQWRAAYGKETAVLCAGAVGTIEQPIPAVPTAIGINQPKGTPQRGFAWWSPPVRPLPEGIRQGGFSCAKGTANALTGSGEGSKSSNKNVGASIPPNSR